MRSYIIRVVLTILIVASAPAIQPTTAEPVPPNFWDPRATVDRPGAVPDTIRFLASDDFPPFAFRDSTGRLTGFNVDLARAICEELQAACALRIKSFDALVPALVREEGDAIIAGLAQTPENLKTLRFSDAYLRLPARFVTRKDQTIEALPETLAGARVSVVEGTVHQAFLDRFFPDTKAVAFATVDEARQALADGEVAAHFGDGLALSFWLNGASSEGCCRFAGGPWLEPGYFDRGMTVAFRFEDEMRQQAVNFALRRLQAKGIYSELYLRYFPISFF